MFEMFWARAAGGGGQAALCDAGARMCKTAEQMRGLTADNDLSYSTAQSALRLYMWGG